MKTENLKTTTNSSVYNKLLRKKLSNDEGLCFICGPHSGCNYWKRYKGKINWKEYRKTQWR